MSTVILLILIILSVHGGMSMTCSKFSYNILYDPQTTQPVVTYDVKVTTASDATSKVLALVTTQQTGQYECATYVVLDVYTSGALRWTVASLNQPANTFACEAIGNTATSGLSLPAFVLSLSGISTHYTLYGTCCMYSDGCNAPTSTELNSWWFGLPGGPALSSAMNIAWATFSLPPMHPSAPSSTTVTPTAVAPATATPATVTPTAVAPATAPPATITSTADPSTGAYGTTPSVGTGTYPGTVAGAIPSVVPGETTSTPSNSGLSTGAIAGIAAGAGGGVLVITVIATVYYRRTRAKVTGL